MAKAALVPASRIERVIYVVRGEKVMIDADLARLYGVPTKALLQAVKRNAARFPSDFMFELSLRDLEGLRSQIVTSKSVRTRGGRRYPPRAFTEQGVAMLSSVLRSERAVRMNVEIIRAFVRLRRLVATHEAIAARLTELERRYDGRFRVVFQALRDIMTPRVVVPQRRRIGFGPAAKTLPARQPAVSSAARSRAVSRVAGLACRPAPAACASSTPESRRRRRR